jgi:hypothetical protein
LRVNAEAIRVNMMSGDLLQQLRWVHDGPRTEKEFCVGSTLCAGRQMEVSFRFGFGIDLVARVRPSHAHEQGILRRYVTNDVALSFTPILSTNEYINQRGSDARIEPK